MILCDDFFLVQFYSFFLFGDQLPNSVHLSSRPTLLNVPECLWKDRYTDSSKDLISFDEDEMFKPSWNS
ncbi:unnamed protein product [Larinioides sclopetarius]|uniref:Uncharacterized protein n=1 Tax=Larinioides sclopetarius TaxID=280406 RepID=A0AAV2A8Z6_9ARAC